MLIERLCNARESNADRQRERGREKIIRYCLQLANKCLLSDSLKLLLAYLSRKTKCGLWNYGDENGVSDHNHHHHHQTTLSLKLSKTVFLVGCTYTYLQQAYLQCYNIFSLLIDYTLSTAMELECQHLIFFYIFSLYPCSQKPG